MFNGRSADGKIQDDRIHMAEMVALMGPPPLRFLERSTRMTRALWNEDGKFIAPCFLFSFLLRFYFNFRHIYIYMYIPDCTAPCLLTSCLMPLTNV